VKGMHENTLVVVVDPWIGIAAGVDDSSIGAFAGDCGDDN